MVIVGMRIRVVLSTMTQIRPFLHHRICKFLFLFFFYWTWNPTQDYPDLVAGLAGVLGATIRNRGRTRKLLPSVKDGTFHLRSICGISWLSWAGGIEAFSDCRYQPAS